MNYAAWRQPAEGSGAVVVESGRVVAQELVDAEIAHLHVGYDSVVAVVGVECERAVFVLGEVVRIDPPFAKLGESVGCDLVARGHCEVNFGSGLVDSLKLLTVDGELHEWRAFECEGIERDGIAGGRLLCHPAASDAE